MLLAILVTVTLVAVGVFAILFLQSPMAKGDLGLEPLFEDLAFPVSLAFAPDGRMYYNELKEGNVRIVENGEILDTPFLTLDVAQPGETGLLGLALDPNFDTTPYVYIYYSYEEEGQLQNRISRFEDLGNVAGPEDVLLQGIAGSTNHNSGRLTFGPDGMLYASVGDALNRDAAQDLSSLNGKILRMRPDGRTPEDNPFASLVYLLGIRNVFGLDFAPDGALLFTENGPSGYDEVNFGHPGSNHGWPAVAGTSSDERFVDPILVFNPAIAPTGVAYYTGGSLGPSYTGVAFFGSWNDGALRTLTEDQGGAYGSVVELVAGRNGILDVVDGPDGFLYLSTPNAIHRVVVTEAQDQTASLQAPRLTSRKSLIGSPITSRESLLASTSLVSWAGGLGWSRAPG